MEMNQLCLMTCTHHFLQFLKHQKLRAQSLSFSWRPRPFRRFWSFLPLPGPRGLANQILIKRRFALCYSVAWSELSLSVFLLFVFQRLRKNYNLGTLCLATQLAVTIGHNNVRLCVASLPVASVEVLAPWVIEILTHSLP